jgi:hypothetical protein
MTEAVRRLAEDPVLRAEMGRQATMHAHEHFDVRHQVEITLQEYSSLLPE